MALLSTEERKALMLDEDSNSESEIEINLNNNVPPDQRHYRKSGLMVSQKFILKFSNQCALECQYYILRKLTSNVLEHSRFYSPSPIAGAVVRTSDFQSVDQKFGFEPG